MTYKEELTRLIILATVEFICGFLLIAKFIQVSLQSFNEGSGMFVISLIMAAFFTWLFVWLVSMEYDSIKDEYNK